MVNGKYAYNFYRYLEKYFVPLHCNSADLQYLGGSHFMMIAP